MSIDMGRVWEMLEQDAATGWAETVSSVRPYGGEMEVAAAVARLLNDETLPPLTSLNLRRLLVTLISADGGGRDHGYVVWHKHNGDTVRLVPIPEEVERENKTIWAWISKEA